MKLGKLLLLSTLLASACAAQASVVSVPDSALVASTGYYTDTIGGGIGNVVVMTGGGNANGAGDPSGRNDDGFSGPINLGFTLNFFGNNYTSFFINNNGNISFNNGISAFTPTGPQGAAEPIISPFFADVDTRNPNSGVVHLRTDVPDEIIVTWDNVGYYSAQATQTDSFQLVLRGPGYSVPTGEGSIGFFYGHMGWETGQASGGVNGFGGTPAAVGFGDGSSNGEVLDGSIHNGISGIVNDHHIWFDAHLAPVPVPEPMPLALLGLGVAGLAASRRKRK